MRKIVSFMEFLFLENAFIKAFLLILLPTQNSPPRSCHLSQGRRKLLILSGSLLSKICVPQQQKIVEETLIFLTVSKFSQKI